MSSESSNNHETSENGRSLSQHPGFDTFVSGNVNNCPDSSSAATTASVVTGPSVESNVSVSCSTPPGNHETSENVGSLSQHP